MGINHKTKENTLEIHLPEQCLDLSDMMLSFYYSDTNYAVYRLYEIAVVFSISKCKSINPVV